MVGRSLRRYHFFQSLIKLSSNHWASELDTPKSKLSKLKSKCEEAAEDEFWGPLQEATATPIIEVTVVVLAPTIFLGGGDKRWQVELLLAYEEVEDRLSHFVEVEDVAEAEEGWSSRSLLIQVTWNYEKRMLFYRQYFLSFWKELFLHWK